MADCSKAYSQTTRTVSKSCGKCGKKVSVTSKIGDRCPHCGVRWGYENSSTTASTYPSTSSPQNTQGYQLLSSSPTSTNKKKANNVVAQPKVTNPFSTYTKQLTEQWILQKLKSYSQKRIYCPTNSIREFSPCTTYDGFEFKFASEYLIIKYTYENDYDILVYIPIYDFNYSFGTDYSYELSFNTKAKTMYEVTKKYNDKHVIDYISIGFKNNAEVDLLKNIDFAFEHLKKFYRKPSTSFLPEFTPESEINKPTLSETQNWILSKLNAYKQNLSEGSYDGTSSSTNSNFNFSFSGFNLIVTFNETSSLKANGYNNSWASSYTVTIPTCDCYTLRPNNNRGVGSMSYGGGNFGFSSSQKNIYQVDQNNRSSNLQKFNINIDLDRETDIFNRLQKAFTNLKSYCPTISKPKEAF